MKLFPQIGETKDSVAPENSMNIHITRDKLFELMEMDGVIELSDTPTKHDCSRVTFVVPKDGKYWKVSYERSYNDGIQDDFGIYMSEVEPYEVTETKWRAVK